MQPPLDYSKACRILQIFPDKNMGAYNDDRFNLIKKSYYKLALKHHPDKGGDPVRFTEIKTAYDFIIVAEKQQGNTTNDKCDGTFENMFASLIQSMIQNKTGFEKFDTLFINTTLHSILKKCDTYSIKVFEQLDIEKCRLIYDFLSLNKDTFYLSDEQLCKYKDVIRNKIKNNNIILLNPSISDILNDNIYKLELQNDIHYIPLWHPEISIDNMIIKNIPDISDNITINANHDIILKHSACITEFFEKEMISIKIGNSNFDIYANQVKIVKDVQFIVFKARGKLIPNKHNLYSSTKRSNIIIELSLIQSVN